MRNSTNSGSQAGYNRFLLVVAWLGELRSGQLDQLDPRFITTMLQHGWTGRRGGVTKWFSDQDPQLRGDHLSSDTGGKEGDPAHYPEKNGFALVVTLALMILLTVIAVGLLTLSSISLRASTQGEAMAVARSNARLALMLAIGDLQKSVAQDQRITAPAGVLDSSPDSTVIDGVDHANWLGVWDSWGTWLNATYASPNGSLRIQDTYVPGRNPMFRNWLVSGLSATGLEAAKQSAPFMDSSVVLVKSISSGDTRETRAGMIPIQTGTRRAGGLAWWVGGENLKADIALNSPPVSVAAAATEVANGNAGTRRLVEVDGMEKMSRDPAVTAKLLTVGQARLADADDLKLRQNFHDFTAYSAGLLTDSRWGGLRRDLSLLFDRPSLPQTLRRSGVSSKSPRPMSSDLLANSPKLPQRPFSSFEQMHAFSRQYVNASGLTDDLSWSGRSPFTKATNVNASNNPDELEYRRMPVLVKSYCIFNLQTERVVGSSPPAYRYFLTYSPVVQLWNPYNTPLEVDSGVLESHSLPYKIISVQYKKMLGSVPQGSWTGVDTNMMLEFSPSIYTASSGSGTIRFKPGEFILFSLKTRSSGNSLSGAQLTPGFDPGAVGSIRAEVRFSPAPAAGEQPGLALRIRPHISGAGDIANYFGGNPGAFCQQLNWRTYSGINVDWFGDAAGDYTMFAPDSGANVARWQTSDTNPVPVAVFGMTLKSSEKLTYDSPQDDWRSRTWLQAPPAFDSETMLAVYNNPILLAQQRRNCSLQAHWRTVSGTAELGEVIPHIGNSGFMGSASAGSEKVAAAAVLELPSAPVQSLAGYAGMRLQPGWFNYMTLDAPGPPGASNVADSNANMAWRQKVGSYRSGVPGVGVGNSFACPMIPGDKVYVYHDISKLNTKSHDPPHAGLPPSKEDCKAFSDFWDHGLLVNDGLWDSCYVSSLNNARRPTDNSQLTLAQLLTKTFTDLQPLPNANFRPAGGFNPTSVASDLQQTDGYLRSAQYLVNRGAFNVNSVSVNAWHALLSSLKDYEAVYRDDSGNIQKIPAPTGSAVVTRFSTETSAAECPNPRSGVMANGLPSWSGVRFLSDAQLRTLAEKCVEQVKRRGPFLNFSDFVNRRLSTDSLGTKGALQAAIDYDDDSPDAASINHRFKSSADMITLGDPSVQAAGYPFPAASAGSRFTAAPGYVVQSDVLKHLGNAMAVRDDTFRIRAYGQAVDANGKVTARAWCEAIIQRGVSYIDSVNAPTVEAVKLDTIGNPSPNAALSVANKAFGRRLELVSFRWLSDSEL